MENNRSPTLAVRIKGDLACFTRPELKVERMSYPVMTPSAARGVLEAILWKPAIRWVVETVQVLAPIQFIAFRRNEVSTKAPKPSVTTVSSGGEAPLFFADEEQARAQRNTVALRQVDYVIGAHFELTSKAGAEDNATKFVAMFRRRVAKGQHYHQPYLGCREFPAEVLPAEDAPKPIPETRNLDIMLWDIAYGRKENRPVFFRAELQEGVLEVPANAQSALAGLEGGGA